MNILYIGEETRNWIIRLANELSLLDNTITVVVKKYDEYDDSNRVIPLEKVTVIEVDDGAFYNPTTIPSIIGERMKTFDVVYGSHIIACIPVVGIGQRYNIPYGTQVLDVPLDLMEVQPQRMANWKIYFKLLKDATEMTFITKKARDDWKLCTGKEYSDDNIITYAATVPHTFKNLGIDIEGDYVVSACRLTPIKNISMITKAISLIDKPIKQVVIGRDNGDKQNILEIARDNSIDVTFYDNVSEADKFELIKNSLCVVYPQQTEYIGGLNPWEGMMIGKPVICTDYQILKDLYKEHVTYFDRASVQDLADIIEEVYDKGCDKQKLRAASIYAYNEACFENMAFKLNKILKRMKK